MTVCLGVKSDLGVGPETRPSSASADCHDLVAWLDVCSNAPDGVVASARPRVGRVTARLPVDSTVQPRPQDLQRSLKHLTPCVGDSRSSSASPALHTVRLSRPARAWVYSAPTGCVV
jgi:hypothetical protein